MSMIKLFSVIRFNLSLLILSILLLVPLASASFPFQYTVISNKEIELNQFVTVLEMNATPSTTDVKNAIDAGKSNNIVVDTVTKDGDYYVVKGHLVNYRISKNHLFNPWFNVSWSNLKAITITTNGTSTPAWYQVKLNVSYEPEMQSDFDDLRFTNSSDGQLSYWIESKVNGSYATVWVNLSDAIADPGSDIVRMYYGNPAVSDSSDGESTFDFFDEFSGVSLDTGKWNVTGDPVLDGVGNLRIGYAGTYNMVISKNYQISDGIIETRVKANGTASYFEWGIFARSSISTGNPMVSSGTQNTHDINSAVAYHAIEIASVVKANSAVAPTINTWYNSRFTLNGVSLKSDRFADGTWTSPLATISYVDSGGRTTGYIGLATYGDRQGYYDLIKVRKYIANEPVIEFRTGVFTNACSDETTQGATLHGTLANITGSNTVWFEWGASRTTYKYKTADQTMTDIGTFSAILSGMPITSNSVYYFRAVANDGTNTFYGDQESFTTLALGEIPDNNFDAHFDELLDAELNPTNMSSVATSPFTDIFGSVFWGVLFAAIFIFMWIRLEDITIPSILGLIIGGSLWVLMPADWVSMAMSLTVVSFGGLVYSLIRGRS